MLPSFLDPWSESLNSLWWEPGLNASDTKLLGKRQSSGAFDHNPNGSEFLWILEDTYQGETFFDRWDFFTGTDPTNYQDRNSSFAKGLVYVENNGKVVMRGDNYTWLAAGVNRASVRISSVPQYNTGLFILDLDRVPWGCATWPAYWLLGNGQWPNSGEIDIIEGVHDNSHNQVTFHTKAGCYLDPSVNMTGTIEQNSNGTDNLVCDGTVNDNSGCAVIEWSRASYGEYFESQGGGVFATKWDENEIATWSFYRAAIPQDILAGTPNPSGWGTPAAKLVPNNCNPFSSFFINMSIVFGGITTGDWAGNSYATSGCPGTCEQRLEDPSNFVNASWIINHLTVYSKQPINGQIASNGGSASVFAQSTFASIFYPSLLFGVATSLFI
ncbi:glycoside hydrolase family 16 protein [Thelephora terrestris]|uniref:Glycoside hydrolase family 16 protein n=1 Tax=Thelephora terrestris TaxID=56493 RepID=A0A9P6HDZ3_9AGAM|nr:glycoside hydrolase family 16 protein [Thelephora terrestris]